MAGPLLPVIHSLALPGGSEQGVCRCLGVDTAHSPAEVLLTPHCLQGPSGVAQLLQDA